MVGATAVGENGDRAAMGVVVGARYVRGIRIAKNCPGAQRVNPFARTVRAVRLPAVRSAVRSLQPIHRQE